MKMNIITPIHYFSTTQGVAFMKYIRLLYASLLMTFLCTSSQLMANVFASNIRVTQQGEQGAFDNRFFDGTGVSIRFVLSDHADSVVALIKQGATVIRTFSTPNLSIGDTDVVWDGKDNNGVYVGSATYSVALTTYDKGYATYTEVSYPDAAGLSMRGMTTVNNPLLKNFGFVFDVDNGGFQGTTGVGRFTSDGMPWGNVKGTNQLTTTGLALGGSEARWASQADKDGYIYVCARTAKQIYRYNTDSLNVAVVDSTYDFYPIGLGIMEETVGKTIAVVTESSAGSTRSDCKILSFHLNSASDKFFGTKDTLLKKPATDSIMFWDVAFGRDSVMYVSFYYNSNLIRSGVARFDLKGKTLPMTMADTTWTVRSDTGLVSTLSMFQGSAADGSEDILYYVNARIASGNPPSGQGIYAITGLNTATPTKMEAYADKQNNASLIRSDISVDAVGNIVYFENSNEEIAVISPPTGPNNYTTTSSFDVQVIPSTPINQAVVDANKDYIPDNLGDTLTIIGIVNSVNFQGGANLQYIIQDDSAGIMVFKFGAPTDTLHIGDQIVVKGVITQYRGTTEITPDTLYVINTGMPVKTLSLTIPQFKANPEAYESRFIKINGLAKTATSPAWPAAGSDANFRMWDGWDSVLVRIDKDAHVSGSIEPTYPVNVQGVVTQFTSSAAVYNDGYQLSPNDSTDFTSAGNIPPNPHFALATPADSTQLKIDSLAQTFKFTWNKALDFNGDNLIYQWLPVGGAAVTTGSSGADSFLVRTGTQLLALMAGKDTSVLKWSVRTKDPSNPIVLNTDTVSVTLIKSSTITGVIASDLLPTVYSLSQNYPNPFNPSTTLRYGIPEESNVTLKIYNMLGQEVATLVNQKQAQGYYDVNFNASRLSTGVYIYRIEAGSYVSVKKMMLLK
jgi:hypothetical protein